MTEFTFVHALQAAPACGPALPPDGEIARALLLVLPLFLLTVPLFRRLTARWRGPWARDKRRGQTLWRCTFWASVVSALANLPGATSLTFGLALLAIWIAGASWVALCLVGWRVLIHRHPELAAWAPPLVVTAVFTVLAWMARASSFGDVSFFVVVLPGVAGVVPLALLVGFVAEAAVRGFLRRRVQAAWL